MLGLFHVAAPPRRKGVSLSTVARTRPLVHYPVSDGWLRGYALRPVDAQHPGDDLVEFAIVEDLHPVVAHDALSAIVHRDQARIGEQVRAAQSIGQRDLHMSEKHCLCGGFGHTHRAPGVELPQALVTHPGIDVADGWAGDRPRRDGGRRTALAPLLLELGANDAAIAPDITVSDRLVEQLVTATYTIGGQVCMSIKRLYAPRDRVDELSEAVLARCEREVLGDGLADKVTGQLVAGTVSVNCHGMAAQDPRVPFGGVGQSGLGRELGADRIRAFTQSRGYVRQPAPQ